MTRFGIRDGGNRSIVLGATLALAFSVAGLACAPHKDTGTGTTNPTTSDAESQGLADDGTDTAATEGDAQALTGTLIASSGTGVGLASQPAAGDLTAQNIVGGGARLFFLPAGCLVVTNPTAASVQYTFNDCTGPRGLTHLTGVLNVDYTTTANSLTLTMTAMGMKVNRATIDWNATAVTTASGAMRTMQWTGHFTGTTGGGRAIERDNTKTVTWTVGDSCFEINGTSVGNVTGKDLKTELIDYKRCRAACPEAGSEIKITRESTGRTVDLTYGTDTATFTDARGDQIEFTPLCAAL
jgi:hypothetical protein